jgi:UDP-N-acetylglucosamine 4,6-dehydratase
MSYLLNKHDVEKLLNNKTIFISGGTGSFGNKLVNTIFTHFTPKKVIIYSRDEFKQYVMEKKFPNKYPIEYYVGDIRDARRLEFCLVNVDVIFHAAALKQVPRMETNPYEAVKTNIIGTQNIIECAIQCQVEKVICISTDKCVNPVNLYGATKLCFEKLVIAGNYLSQGKTKFSVFRYGNVMGSRGSVVPLFINQKDTGRLTITDENMTRFNMTLDSAINFVLNSASNMIGGEIFVPKLKSYNILQVARVISPDAIIEIIGTRPGEKIHELMISISESHLTIDANDKYVVLHTGVENKTEYEKIYGNKMCPPNWDYSSGKNELLEDMELAQLIEDNKDQIILS